MLKEDPRDLATYYRQVSLYSPDSHPEQFPTTDDRLAYWINAYNATAMWNVVVHYPIGSVLDVGPSFLPKKTGFFLAQRFTYGGKNTNLFYLENQVIRKRFKDPRIHFALNCASVGCPQLPQKPFTGKNLDHELDRETRSFINDPTYVRIDSLTSTVHLSSIFDWYRQDFTSWLKKNHPGQDPSLTNYLKLYLSPDNRRHLDALGENPEIQFISYDWKLNDKTR